MKQANGLNDADKFLKRQNRLFGWSLCAFILLVVSLTASAFRHLLGFDPHWAGDNFVFNLAFLFPAAIISTVVLYFTGGLTIIYWRSFPSLPKKITIVVLSGGVLLLIVCMFVLIMRRH